MRPLVLAVSLLVVAGGHAQTVPEPSTYGPAPDSEIVLQWLQSPDSRLQAWAARDILVNGLINLVPDLQSKLERTSSDPVSDVARVSNRRATLAMLDTLIQLGATVPAATLDRIEKRGYNASTEELVLLSRLPSDEAEASLRTFYPPALGSGSRESRVAAQLLVRHPPRGFAAEVLSSIVVTGNIVVHDIGSSGGMGYGSSSCCGAGAGPATDDWPEIGRYTFQDPPQKGQPLPEGETLFLPGPDPVYLRRSVSRSYIAGGCGGLSPLNDAIRSHLVGTLLNGSATSPFPEQPVLVDIPFKTRESYRARVQAFVEEQQQNFHKVAEALTALNLLTEEERQAATLRIHLSLQDSRSQPAVDLPPLSFRPPVEWIAPF